MLLRTSGQILATPLDMIKFWLSTNGTKKRNAKLYFETWCLCCSCGSVKHGWEKKWVVLDDQVLQLYDKENMGGE